MTKPLATTQGGLKTLKDLDVTEANGGLFVEGELFIPQMVLLKDLKQMAIGWIKDFDRIAKRCKTPDAKRAHQMTADHLRLIFDIKEEDLE